MRKHVMIRNAACTMLSVFVVVACAAPAFATDQNSPVQNSPVQHSPVQHGPVLNRPGNVGDPDRPGYCPDCLKPRQHYDSQEVVHTTQDVDQSRVVNTTSVVPVAPRMKETNHLVIRKNTIRNVGVVQHNHTIIEKEIRYRRPVQRTKAVGYYVMQGYQTVYQPAMVYVPVVVPVRYAVPHHYYPKQYYYPQHHYQQSCCQQQYQYPQQYYQQHDYYRTGLLQVRG